jgi:hypothetical protein
MFAQTITLTQEKGEHTPLTYEDAPLAHPDQGLFALADGAGTTLFSREWARFLVQQYISTPFFSANPFELQWWIELAQKGFAKQELDVTSLPWTLQKKAREGSASTFAALCITSVQAASVSAQAFVLGDTCIFIGKEATQTVHAFPLLETAEFEKAPNCFSSLPRKFSRSHHRCLSHQVQLCGNDIIILATDAVARWLLSHTDASTRWRAFQGLAGMSETTWGPFIIGCRERREMADDDSTIIVVRFHAGKRGEPIGITSSIDDQMIAQRHSEFLEAMNEGDKERMAVVYGDGRAFTRAKFKISQEMIEDARLVADALNEVRQMYFMTANRHDASMQIERTWRKHEALFQRAENRTSVEKLLHMLQANGVLREISLPVAPPLTTETGSSFGFWVWLQGVVRALLQW